MRFIYAIGLCLFALAACGDQHASVGVAHKAQAVNVQQWQGSEQLRANKNTIVNTARSLGADQKRIALLVAMACQETQNISAAERDTSKDGDGTNPSRNYSAYNMNRDFIQYIGYDINKAEALNDDANLAEATRVLMMGLDKLGEESCLSFHRGGRAALNDGFSYGAKEYKEAIHSTQQYILANPCLLTDNQRCGCDVEHV